MTLPWFAEWLFIPAWASGRVMITLAWYHTYWNKNWKPDKLTIPLLKLAGVAWWISVAFVPLALIYCRTFGAEDFFLWVGFVVVAVYLHSLFVRKLEGRITGCAAKPFPLSATPLPRPVVILMWIGACFLMLVTFPLSLLGIAVFFFLNWLVKKGRRSLRTFGAAFELDPSTPLFCNISSVMLPFGRTVNHVYFRRRPGKSGILHIPPITARGYADDTETIPIIPFENLTFLNSHTFLTALALFWAGRVRPHSFSAQQPGCFWGCSVALILSTILFIGVLVVGWLYGVVSDGGNITALPVVIFAVVFIAWPTLRQLGLFRTRFDMYKDAFEVIRTLSSEWLSTQEFVNSVAEHHAFYHCIRDADLVVHQVGMDGALARFCRKRCNEDLNQLLTEARSHVSAMIQCWTGGD